MPRKTRMAYFGPLDASRNVAIECSVGAPSEANFGITVFPNLDGSEIYACRPCTPFPFVPSELRSGAPRLPPPVPRYVWHAVHPDVAKKFAPLTACGLFAKPSRFAHVGTAAFTSLASASFAVAPL